MKWSREYGIPALVILTAALVVCIGLWLTYTPTTIANASIALRGEDVEREMSNLGIIAAVMAFVFNTLKISLMMGIPGFITLKILNHTSDDKQKVDA